MADALRALAGTSRGPTRWLRLSRKRAAAVAALLALATIAVGTLMWRAGRASPPPAPVPSRQLTFTGAATLPEVDLNGRFVAYWNDDSLLMQDVSGGEPIEVFQGRGGPARWSPDGLELVVSAETGTLIVPRSGGTPRQIEPRRRPIFPVWRDESTIVGLETSVGGLAIVARDIDLGVPTVECDLSDMTSFSGFDWSPAQNAFLVLSSGKNVRYALRTFRRGDCRSTLIVNFDGQGTRKARWASDGKAIYYMNQSDSAGALWKVRVGFSAEPLGTPTLVREGITGSFSMSSNNILLHERRTTSSTIAVVSDAKAGAVVRPITEGTAVDTDPEFSPDGTRIAFARQGNIHVASDDGRSPRRITSSFKTAARPVWSPDARRIAFRTAEGGDVTIWTVDVDAGTLRSFAGSVRMRVNSSRLHWAPAAEILFFDVNDDISAVDPESGVVRLLTKPFFRRAPPSLPPEFKVHPSPDHSHVVVLQQPAGGSGVTSILSLSGITYKVYAFSEGGGVTDERNLLRRPDARYGRVIGWASDDWIYVHGENPREIFRIPAAGGLATHVVTLPEPPLFVSSISTGNGATRFVGTVAKTLSDVWLAENFDQDR
jgi:dipeptidyl aminopeptidase/acylaminoacyl peptidase